MTNRVDRCRWQAARTLAEVGEVTALWLEGEIAESPAYCGRPDPETEPLIPALAALNRGCLVTLGSQPGHGAVVGYDGRDWWQRAAVEAFADRDMLTRLFAATVHTDLLLISGRAPRWRRHYSIPVTIAEHRGTDEWQVYTDFGGRIPHREVAFLYRVCHGDAIHALQQAWQVTIIDPEWGRNDVLWPALERATSSLPRRTDSPSDMAS